MWGRVWVAWKTDPLQTGGSKDSELEHLASLENFWVRRQEDQAGCEGGSSDAWFPGNCQGFLGGELTFRHTDILLRSASRNASKRGSSAGRAPDELVESPDSPCCKCYVDSQSHKNGRNHEVVFDHGPWALVWSISPQ